MTAGELDDQRDRHCQRRSSEPFTAIDLTGLFGNLESTG